MPEYSQVFRSKSVPVGEHSSPPQCVVRRQHEKVLPEVTSMNLTVKCAAVVHGVPKSTLHDRVSGKVLPCSIGGAPKHLSD